MQGLLVIESLLRSPQFAPLGQVVAQRISAAHSTD